MQKKLTITIDEKVYFALYAVIGKGHISQFLEDLARPHVLRTELADAYQSMAKDAKREQAADAWCDDAIGDFLDENKTR